MAASERLMPIEGRRKCKSRLLFSTTSVGSTCASLRASLHNVSPSLSNTRHSLQPSIYPDWLIRRKDFLDMKSKYERLDTIDSFQVCFKPAAMRTHLEVKAVVKTVKRNPFFSSMKEAELMEVVERLHSVFFPKTEVMMRKNEPADCLYLILEGKVGVYIEEEKCLDEIIAGNVVGESAIQTWSMRSATVIAHEDVYTLRLTYEDYNHVLYKLKQQDYLLVAKFLQSQPFFATWNHGKLYRLASVIMVKQYEKGQRICQRGETPHDLYLVQKGCVSLTINLSLTKTNRWPVGSHSWHQLNMVNSFEVVLKECRPGEFFGGQELIQQGKMRATAVCTSDTALLLILREEFFQEIFSEKDQQSLYNHVYSRPETPQLSELLSYIHTQVHSSTKAILDALDTNPVPIGRAIFEAPRHKKKELSARLLNQARKTQEKPRTIRRISKITEEAMD